MLDDSDKQPNRAKGWQAGRLERPWLFLLIFGVLFAIVALVISWPSPISSVDLNQPWLNTALPPPTEDSQILFGFTPNRDSLNEIELEIARYGSDSSGDILEFQLLDAADELIISDSWSPAAQANQAYVLNIPPQKNSAGQRYTLAIGGSRDNTFAPWGYDLDVLDQTDLTVHGDETSAVELHFTTRYQLSIPAALVDLARITSSNAGFIILFILFLLLPGCLVLLAGWPRTRSWDPAAWIGAALAIGVAFWPLLWLWLSAIGVAWASWSLWTIFVLGWIGVTALFLWRTGYRFQSRKLIRLSSPPITRPFQKGHLLLLLILLIGLAVRLLAVRDLAFPAWVDSSRHALITAVMAENGRVISDYAPFLPVTRFPYHFGFHTLSASLFLMTGIELQQLLLILGQLLNALVPLAVYAGALMITKRFRAALVAAFLVALPFLFPGYYATWGRMTQLSAMIILPVALAFTWLIVRGAQNWRKSWWLLAMLASGLFLIHIRVFLLYLPFVALVWLFSKGRNGRWLALATGLSMLLIVPRIISLFDDINATGIGGKLPGYNDFPTGYLNSGWERYFLILAAAFMFISLVAVLRTRHWAWLPLFLAGWVGLVTLLLWTRVPGLLSSTLININSAYITFFLPLAWILAIVLDRLFIWLSARSRAGRVAGYAATAALFTAAFFLGINQQIDILNPQTILAQEPDVLGLDWLDQNLPSNAKVAVNSWQWLGNTWTGNDGGAWILPLTGRETTTPPADYIYESELSRDVATFNDRASQVEDWSDPDQITWLREMDVTHIYSGARGGFFDPSELSHNPEVREIFRSDGVFIFALK